MCTETIGLMVLNYGGISVAMLLDIRRDICRNGYKVAGHSYCCLYRIDVVASSFPRRPGVAKHAFSTLGTYK